MTTPALLAVRVATALGGRLRTPPTDPLGPVGQDPDVSRDAACRIVATAEQCRPPSTVLVADDPTPPVASGGGGLSIFGFLLWLLLAAVVVALVIIVVRMVRERAPRIDDGAVDEDRVAGTVMIDRSRNPRGWREEADAHRAAGRHRDALRCRYRALVGDLARRGLLDEIPGRTTGEERRELARTAPDAIAPFRAAADLFDDAWYGSYAVGAADDDRFQALERDVLGRAPTLAHRVPAWAASTEVAEVGS